MDNVSKKRQCIKEKVKIILRQLCFWMLMYCFAFTSYTYLSVKFLKEPFNLKKFVTMRFVLHCYLSLRIYRFARPAKKASTMIRRANWMLYRKCTCDTQNTQCCFFVGLIKKQPKKAAFPPFDNYQKRWYYNSGRDFLQLIFTDI